MIGYYVIIPPTHFKLVVALVQNSAKVTTGLKCFYKVAICRLAYNGLHCLYYSSLHRDLPAIPIPHGH